MDLPTRGAATGTGIAPEPMMPAGTTMLALPGLTDRLSGLRLARDSLGSTGTGTMLALTGLTDRLSGLRLKRDCLG
jgi:hypothetical protein